ncbi:MAG TPA: 3'-5' exonuclease, partial [Anaerolineae bacterium]
LRRCLSRKEAQLYEQLYLTQYGLPGLCFKVKDYQSLDQDAIDLIFASIPTRERAACLAQEMGIDLTMPHYIPSIAKEAVALVYFGGKSNSRHRTHRISFETRNEQTAQRLNNLGVRAAKPSRYYPSRWRIGTERAQYDEAQAFATRVAQQAQTQLVERYALTADKRWEQTSAGQIFPGMQIPIVDNGQILADEVIHVARKPFEGPVYDLAVPHVHNYIANGIVIHNSIYRFRGADVAVFRQVQSDIERAQGLAVDLDLTFRAHRSLLDTTNALLAPILGEADDPLRPYQVPFAPLKAQRRMPESELWREPFIEFQLGFGEDAAEGRQAAASALVERLQQLHDQAGIAWNDIALLFRSSTNFTAYEDALERSGLPFVTVAGRGFYDRPEIRDVLNALAAIADPTDDLALAGLLRSPAVGLSDVDLYHLRIDHDYQPRSIWEALRQLAAHPDRADAARAHHIINELHHLAGRVTAAEVIKRFFDLTGYRALLSAAPGGTRLRRNVDKLLADAHRSRLVSLGEFLEYVQTLRDVGVREGEAPVEAEGALQLMTVHKAKGLEFPLVVIADAAYEHRGHSDSVLLDDELGLLIDLNDAADARPAMWRLAGINEAAKEEAEDKRLLYVAMTRAREKLIVSGHVKRTAKGMLSSRGWLAQLGEVIGLNGIRLEGEVGESCALDVQCPDRPGSIRCELHPSRPIESIIQSEQQAINDVADQPVSDLIAPISIPNQKSETPALHLAQRGASVENQQSRVWRIVPRAKRPSGPA